MTSKFSVIFAISLMINGVHLVFDENILQNKYLASNLVFLISACMLIRQIDVLLRHLWRKLSIVCLLFELPLAIILLETSLYIWCYVQDYIVLHADDILVDLSENKGLNWLVCHLCCGKNKCPDIFALLVMKVASFGFLIAVCRWLS